MSRKSKVLYHPDLFINKDGQQQSFVIAAVVDWLPETNHIVKSVSFGISITHPDDEEVFDLEIGKKIACNRADNPDHAFGTIYVDKCMLLTMKQIDATMEFIAETIKETPDRFTHNRKR